MPLPPPGYLDAASSEPLHPAARKVLATEGADDQGWADPARLYGAARRVRLQLDEARESMAALLRCRPDEVSFTASGTQAVHLAVAGLAAGRRRVGQHTVASAVEHSSVLHALEAVQPVGEPSDATSSLVAVDRLGRVDVEAFAAALRDDTALACLQSANHEVGTLQPVEEVAAVCRDREVPLVVDAAQSLGRGAPPEGWSVLTGSAHKWGGPGGVGVLAVRTGVRWRVPGATDDRGDARVAGFPYVPGIRAAVAALEAVTREAPAEDARLAALTARIRAAVPAAVADVEVVGDPDRRLPHLVTFSCLYADGEALLRELDRAGFAVSSGSSCTSSTLEPSHVLVAMGALSHGNIRISLPRGVVTEDVDRFLAVLPDIVRRVRDELGARS